jgi:hypothetical protein
MSTAQASTKNIQDQKDASSNILFCEQRKGAASMSDRHKEGNPMCNTCRPNGLPLDGALCSGQISYPWMVQCVQVK